MCDDDIFIWYDSELCMRAYVVHRVFPPSRQSELGSPKQSDHLKYRVLHSGQVQP